MIELDDILYALTDLGPDLFPMISREFRETLRGFGLNDNEAFLTQEMLLLTGHIQSVLDEQNRSCFHLRAPYLNQDSDGNYILAGARSNAQDIVQVSTLQEGRVWERYGREVKQPTIYVVEPDELEDLDEVIRENLEIDEAEWSIPIVNLPAWENQVLGEFLDIDLNDLVDYENDWLFNPLTLRWEAMNEEQYSGRAILQNTGPVFLISKRQMYGAPRIIFIVKDADGNCQYKPLPPGRDHVDWAKWMIVAVYGQQVLFRRGDDLVIAGHRGSRNGIRIPSQLETAIIRRDGMLPIFLQNEETVYENIGEQNANQILTQCVFSFTSTEIYARFGVDN